MKRRYDEIMERLEVTDDMKARILSRLKEVEIEKSAAPSEAKWISTMRRYGALVACLAVLLVGGLFLPRFLNRQPPDAGHVTGVLNVTEATSALELSQLVGFTVTDLAQLPFEAEETTYVAYGDQMAQIQYRGEDQTATFRKSRGSEDNSGDYTVYSETHGLSFDEMTVELKGDGGTYTLALWSDGGYAYSLKLEKPMTAEEWRDLISGIAL